jgi:hypothetical protein
VLFGNLILSGIAIAQLPKLFMIFAVRVQGRWLTPQERFLCHQPEARVFTNARWPVFEITIDFENVEEAQAKLEKLTEQVEKECPVAAAFDIHGTGEGIVWTCSEVGWESSRYWFKVKGDKHKNTKTKKAGISPEKLAGIQEVVDTLITENRLAQGFESVKEKLGVNTLTEKNTGDFIKWIITDITEEDIDIVAKSGLTIREISGQASKIARKWFFNKI